MLPPSLPTSPGRRPDALALQGSPARSRGSAQTRRRPRRRAAQSGQESAARAESWSNAAAGGAAGQPRPASALPCSTRPADSRPACRCRPCAGAAARPGGLPRIRARRGFLTALYRTTEVGQGPPLLQPAVHPVSSLRPGACDRGAAGRALTTPAGGLPRTIRGRRGGNAAGPGAARPAVETSPPGRGSRQGSHESNNAACLDRLKTAKSANFRQSPAACGDRGLLAAASATCRAARRRGPGGGGGKMRPGARVAGSRIGGSASGGPAGRMRP